MNKNFLENTKRIHFIGIGGSGMSPIAEILHHKGYSITGSDRAVSDTLERVRSWGIPVSMENRADNVDGADLVVYSAAVPKDNPELTAAQAQGIPTVERSVMLGELVRQYPQSIAVAGTHGKTTTTSMITQIFLEAGRDPSAIIGGKLPSIGSNARVGHSDVIVCEACEYVDTFLQLTPAVSVILNIDEDHLDYFGNLENIILSFRQFASQTTKALVVNGDDPNSKSAVEGLQGPKIVTFGLDPSNDYCAADFSDDARACESFTLLHRGEVLTQIHLSVPGRHNVLNALAAAATAHVCGIAPQDIAKGLQAFAGVHRRFEILGKFHDITVADDFAHHPTELTVTLTAAMQMGFRTVWAIFQPHTFSRTYLLMDDFAKALAIPDKVVMTEILPVREVNTYGVHVRDLAEKVPGSRWFSSFEEICDYVMEQAKPGDLILTLGGGDVYKCANQIVERYKQQEGDPLPEAGRRGGTHGDDKRNQEE